MTTPAATPVRWSDHVRRALSPDSTPAMVSVGIAVVIDLVVTMAVLRFALVAAGHPAEKLTHALLPPLFTGMLAFIGSMGGSTRSGAIRALALSLLGLPLTLVAIWGRELPIIAGLALAAMAAVSGYLAWHGEPFATLGSLLLYMFFLPLVFGAGSGVGIKYLLVGYGAMAVTTVLLRLAVGLLPHHRRPPPAPATDLPGKPSLRERWKLLDQPQLRRLRRTTLRSAIGLGIGAVIMAASRDHNAVWVLMTLIAIIPPYQPLTIDRVLQRLVGTALAMVVLTVIDALIPPGVFRALLFAVGLVLTIAYLKRSYLISVLGVSLVAVIAYAGVSNSLGEALLLRGLDTVIGAVIGIGMTLLIPVGNRPQPVWADQAP